MIPGMNPQMMKQAMKKMGMKQEEINAHEIIIKCADKNLIIRNPEVMKITMMGQESLQITGTIEEETLLNHEDIQTVAQQAAVSEEKAREALEAENGDLAAAIVRLQEQ